MAAKKNMSMEEILAACRSADGDGSAEPSATPATPTSEDSTSEDSTASSSDPTPSTPAAAPAKKAGEMSVEEMLAAARAGKSKPAAAPKAAAKVSSPAAAKSSSKAATPAAKAIPKDTSSILAAARKDVKPGPMSKAEAAVKAKDKLPAKGKPKIVVPPPPEKPAYAMAQQAVEQSPGDRRSFMSTAVGTFVGSFLTVGFTSLGLTHLLWLLGFARFMFPNIRIEPPSEFRVGFPADFAPGQVETKFKAQFGVWIVRTEYEGQTQIFALKSVCTHLGCTPNWLEGEQKFKCPCHGSGFYKDGINFEGPAPRPLERYGISQASDGQLVVDKSKKFNEEKGQWTDSTSFVPV